MTSENVKRDRIAGLPKVTDEVIVLGKKYGTHAVLAAARQAAYRRDWGPAPREEILEALDEYAEMYRHRWGEVQLLERAPTGFLESEAHRAGGDRPVQDGLGDLMDAQLCVPAELVAPEDLPWAVAGLVIRVIEDMDDPVMGSPDFLNMAESGVRRQVDAFAQYLEGRLRDGSFEVEVGLEAEERRPRG